MPGGKEPLAAVPEEEAADLVEGAAWGSQEREGGSGSALQIAAGCSNEWLPPGRDLHQWLCAAVMSRNARGVAVSLDKLNLDQFELV